MSGRDGLDKDVWVEMEIVKNISQLSTWVD